MTILQQQQQLQDSNITIKPDEDIIIDTPCNSSTPSPTSISPPLKHESSKEETAKPKRKCNCNIKFLFTKEWIPFWAINIFSLVILAIVVIYIKQIIPVLVDFSDKIKGLGVGGYLIMISLVFVSCFPPLFGYPTFVLLCGFIFGFPLGFIPAYIGAVAGGILGLPFYRWCIGRKYREILLNKFHHFKTADAVLMTGGLKLVLLIRLSPHPYGFLSVILSTTHVPLQTYSIATAISALHNLLSVYIGTTLRDISAIIGGSGSREKSRLEVAVVIVGVVIAVIAAVYVTRLVKKELRKAEEVDGGEGVGSVVVLDDGDAGEDVEEFEQQQQGEVQRQSQHVSGRISQMQMQMGVGGRGVGGNNINSARSTILSDMDLESGGDRTFVNTSNSTMGRSRDYEVSDKEKGSPGWGDDIIDGLGCGYGYAYPTKRYGDVVNANTRASEIYDSDNWIVKRGINGQSWRNSRRESMPRVSLTLTRPSFSILGMNSFGGRSGFSSEGSEEEEVDLRLESGRV
ncbi:Tlg2-vesicle protein [Blyttiomyces sp. JEL0837]|nr:Tlg2-vesicle protein [Blyttiomyces sp. JEL0837]